MKRQIAFFILLLLTVIHAAAQQQRRLYLSDVFTTVLVFPTAICEGCIDRGHPDVATSQVTGLANVLRVKAVSDSLPATNLTVFTIDGRIYSFEVAYSQSVPVHPIIIPVAQKSPGLFENTLLNQAEVESYASIVSKSWSRAGRPRARTQGKMRVCLSNIYQKSDLLFFKFQIRNESNIDYGIDLQRLYIRDRKVPRRTAIMKKPVDPVFSLPPAGNIIPAKSKGNLVIALKRFTIADNKFFVIELFEKNGDRPLVLKIRGKDLLKARRE